MWPNGIRVILIATNLLLRFWIVPAAARPTRSVLSFPLPAWPRRFREVCRIIRQRRPYLNRWLIEEDRRPPKQNLLRRLRMRLCSAAGAGRIAVVGAIGCRRELTAAWTGTV